VTVTQCIRFSNRRPPKRSELDLFSQDGAAAAQAWVAPYPHALEHAVRRHLREMGLPIS
jgi:hypothetical protein